MSDATDKVFGYATMGRSFREVVRLRREELVYKASRQIAWRDVVGYRAFPDFYPDMVLAAIGSAKPQLALYLRDGQVIRIRGDLLVEGFNEMRREHGIPVAFKELVNAVRERGVPKWNGPKEETVLFTTAWALFLVGLMIGSMVAVLRGAQAMSIGIGVAVGVVLAQAAFIIGPLVARRLRRIYLATS